MYTARSSRLLLLAAAGLWACSDDSSGPPDDTPDPVLPEFHEGINTLGGAERSAIAEILANAGDASGVGADPEAEGAIAAAAQAILGEGKVSGVTASSAGIRNAGGNPQARLVDGTWGVFGATVALYPDTESPVSAYYTGVVALKGNEAAIGIKRAHTEPEILDANAEFPHPKAVGLFFQGRRRGWGAADGYMQVIPKEVIPCGATIPGITCLQGEISVGLEILESVPLQFSGNQASGSREFVLEYGEVQGYAIAVYCDSSEFC